MAAKRIAMEQLKQVLKLYSEGQSIKGIVRLTGLSRDTVRSYPAMASKDVSNIIKQTDAALAANFFYQDISAYKGERYQKLARHFERSDRELSLPDVTRHPLWRQYMARYRISKRIC